MKDILSYFENFAFRAFQFQKRATPLEYWAVIPVIWVIILWALMSDIKEVHGFLLQRTIPPMNPLYYESVLLFLVTLIPRMSLNMRRLHDRNKTGFWVILPAISMIAAIVLFNGLSGAMMNSSLTGLANSPDSPTNILHPLALYVASPDAFWNEMFSIAIAFEKAGSEALWNLLAEIYAHAGAVDVRRYTSNVTREIEGNTGHTIGFAFVAGGLVFTPLVTWFLHAMMTLMPSYPHDNLYGPAKMGALDYKRKVDGKHNPMAGYAHLYEKTDEEKAQRREANAAEVKALYRARVLGQTDDAA